MGGYRYSDEDHFPFQKEGKQPLRGLKKFFAELREVADWKLTGKICLLCGLCAVLVIIVSSSRYLHDVGTYFSGNVTPDIERLQEVIQTAREPQQELIEQPIGKVTMQSYDKGKMYYFLYPDRRIVQVDKKTYESIDPAAPSKAHAESAPPAADTQANLLDAVKTLLKDTR